MTRPLTIYVSCASECLTDHLPHGDGLICYSLLSGLANRGHRIFAYTIHDAVHSKNPNLILHEERASSPAGSLVAFEHGLRSNRWLRQVMKKQSVDVVWRMHPYGIACPLPPATYGRPFVLGPLFYGWPDDPSVRRPFKIGRMLEPLARRGWHKTMSNADLIFCATDQHSSDVAAQQPRARVQTLPVIAEPHHPALATPRTPSGGCRLVFAANLVSNKNPLVYCKVIKGLRDKGLDARGTIIGDGPLRADLEAFCQTSGLKDAVEFIGRVPNAKVFDIVRNAEFLVSTSLGEPYGRGIVEAMSVGTPAICHRSGGPADFIEHGVNGLLVSAIDAEPYTAAIHQALAEQTWKRLSDGALASARRWRTDAVLDQLESHLSALRTARSAP
jgi:glycosyltransferase involved in cell wall biosynthesis